MSLRRFPWKLPRITDNSYKLFITHPDPPADATEHNTSDSQVRPPQPSGTQSDPSSQDHQIHQHHHHQNQSESKDSNQQGQVIKGPWRLLRLLPRESRHIIGRMLKIDPVSRAGLEEVMNDRWVTGGPRCVQEENGNVISAPGHQHTLESDAQG